MVEILNTRDRTGTGYQQIDPQSTDVSSTARGITSRVDHAIDEQDEIRANRYIVPNLVHSIGDQRLIIFLPPFHTADRTRRRCFLPRRRSGNDEQWPVLARLVSRAYMRLAKKRVHTRQETERAITSYRPFKRVTHAVESSLPTARAGVCGGWIRSTLQPPGRHGRALRRSWRGRGKSRVAGA
jgi:hypothetical protein